MWGFRDDLIWTRNAALFRSDWSLKPAGRVWMERVFGDWWTEAQTRTDDRGRAQVRGFHGEYVIEARHSGRRVRQTVQLGPEGRTVSLALDAQAEADEPAQRLTSLNPYRMGRLPKVRDQDRDTRKVVQHHVSVTEGSGAVAVVPQAKKKMSPKGLTIGGGDGCTPGRHAYLRFDLASLKADELVDASLCLAVREAPARSVSLKLYALSPRFIQRTDELGLDWDPQAIDVNNAPGRSADGEDRLGDAAVFYIGEFRFANANAGSQLKFSNVELQRIVAASAGATVTLIVAPRDGETVHLADGQTAQGQSALQLELMLRKPAD